MKLKSCHTALSAAVLFVLLIPFGVHAQDERMAYYTESSSKDPLKQDQEAPSGIENPETRLNKNSAVPVVQEAVVSRDSEIKTAKPTAKTVEKTQKEDEKVQKQEEDPLSFNFLYYIIEKFKQSDIVE